VSSKLRRFQILLTKKYHVVLKLRIHTTHHLKGPPLRRTGGLHGGGGPELLHASARGRVGKKPGFFFKNQPSGFFLGFLVFFYIFAQKREF
jgi:hypothetical protein